MTASGLTPLLQVYDMPEAIDFYCGKLGFEIVQSSPRIDAPEGSYSDWVWLRLGGADLMLNTAYEAGDRPPQRDTARSAVHRDTGLFIGCGDVDAVFDRLSASGLELEPPRTAPYGMKQLYLRDPDGYELCFQQAA